MPRLPFALAAGLSLILAGVVSAAGVDVRWRGHSFFVIESTKGTRVAIDPHAIPEYGRVDLSVDAVLISHEHDDHNQVEVLRVRGKDNVIHGLRQNKDNPRRMEWNDVDKTIGDVRVRAVGTWHDTARGLERGLNTAWVIDVDGLRFVHLGDLAHPLTKDQLERIGPVDVVMVPVGGVYTLNGSEAKEVVNQLKPSRAILPMHYATKAFEDVLPVDEFLEDVPRERIERLPGSKLTIDPDRKPPAQPIIYLMGWK